MSEHYNDDISITIPKSRMVGFRDAVSLGFKNYFNFNGRSSRGAYWYWTLALLIFSIVTITFDAMIYPQSLEPGGIGPLNTILSLITFIPGISISVRRLHDIGRSGWWLLIVFTIIGIIPVIYWACQAGTRAANQFGPDIEAGRKAQDSDPYQQ